MSLNPQGPGKIEWTDFTFNPIQGCQHDCKWIATDGSMAQCYAMTMAQAYRSTTFMPQGFRHHYWHPDRLEEPLALKEPSRIFLDSFSDLMGHWVPDDQIERVIDVCRRASWHQFQVLTKNAPRLLKFTWPDNVWVGVSVPPSWMMGKKLSSNQKLAMLANSIHVLNRVEVPVRWLSVEPLSWNLGRFLKSAHVQWMVIGAATNGAKVYQPDPEWVREVHQVAETMGARVFYKGNLKGNAAAEPWREEYPEERREVAPRLVQQSLL
jgi:protein gp37